MLKNKQVCKGSSDKKKNRRVFLTDLKRSLSVTLFKEENCMQVIQSLFSFVNIKKNKINNA